jgi:hypothetical protein
LPHDAGTSRALSLPVNTAENPMEIKFSHDVDNVLKEAKKQNKPVLLDFSAAPM